MTPTHIQVEPKANTNSWLVSFNHSVLPPNHHDFQARKSQCLQICRRSIHYLPVRYMPLWLPSMLCDKALCPAISSSVYVLLGSPGNLSE